MRDLPEQGGIDVAASELADLRQQVAELRQAVRARDDFIAIAAHELRNPMMPILAIAELALKTARNAEDKCPARITTLLERMESSAQDFVRRSVQLLDVSRIESGNLRLLPSLIDVSWLVRSVAEKYGAIAARGRTQLVLDVEDGISGVLDLLSVEQIIENLLCNALKFGIGEPVTLRLCLDGEAARLDVQDQGIGMSPDQQARLFSRFEQIVAQHRGGGFGVGLWLAHRLVTAMEGRIDILSCVGQGSTFRVTLPLAPLARDRTTDGSA